MRRLLCDLGICNEDTIVPLYPKTRDRDDISVFKCERSEVIFLSRSDHTGDSHYKKKRQPTQTSFEENYKKNSSVQEAQRFRQEDSNRRLAQFKNVIANKKWLDVGTGFSGILDLLSPYSSKTLAVEPQEDAREYLKQECKYEAFSSVDDVPCNDIDIVTLFHVFEHLNNPTEALKSIKKKMTKGGKVIIEVPHARDFLLSFLNLECYKAFSFWSEHLILHTRESLTAFLKLAGFSNISILGYQRYPLANHLYWLAKSKPGGHLIWDHLRTRELDEAYANTLSNLDVTDTLIATAVNE